MRLCLGIWTLQLLLTPSLTQAQTSPSSGDEDGLLITTNVGKFKGHFAPSSSSSSQTSVREWLGIRYASAPTRALRFRPPQRAPRLRPDSAVFNASDYSPSCPQNRGSSYTGFNAISSLGNATDGEDCLSVNIWAPTVSRLNSTTARNSTYEGAAVLIWFYGGAFAFGTSNTPYYDGSSFVRDQSDIIVVSFNYRTNIFGFPSGASGLSPFARNLGLEDQRLAVEWVYNNIREFGGDPERITIFGESAGSGSIGAWPYAYQFDPIVKGFIMESGSEVTLAQSAVSNFTNAGLAWEYVASNAGCALNATGTPQLQLQCMQRLDFHVIQNITSRYSGAGTFVPSVDNITVFSGPGYAAKMRSGEFAHVPTLIGNNANEGSILVALYPGSSAINVTTYGYTCPNALIAQARSAAGVPAWQYRYEGIYPSLSPIPALGVYHSSEIPLVFGTYNISTLGTANAALIATSKVVQGGWAAFARDPVSGLTQYGWPQYNLTGNTLIELGYNNQSVPNYANTTMFNGPCNIPVNLTRGF